MKDVAKLIVAGTVISEGENSISVEARKILVECIEKALIKAYTQGQEDAVFSLFPSTDDYYGPSPLQKAAFDIVFKE